MFRLKFLVPFDFTHFRTRPNNMSIQAFKNPTIRFDINIYYYM